MKKRVLLSLVTLSSGLLSNDYPQSQQPTNRRFGPSRQQENQASRQEQDRTLQGPRSPRRPIVQTPGPRITADAGRQLNQDYQRAMNQATHERQPQARPGQLIIPNRNFANDPSDNRNQSTDL